MEYTVVKKTEKKQIKKIKKIKKKVKKKTTKNMTKNKKIDLQKGNSNMFKEMTHQKIESLNVHSNMLKEMTPNTNKMISKEFHISPARKRVFTFREDSWLNDPLMDAVKTVCISDLKGIDNTGNGYCLLLQKKHMNGCRIGTEYKRYSEKKKKFIKDKRGCDGIKTCLSAFRVLENHIKDDELMFKVVKNSRHYFGKMKKTDYLTIIKKISKEKICFYECVPYTRPFRVAFDIDGNGEMLSKLKEKYYITKFKDPSQPTIEEISRKNDEKDWGDDLILKVALEAINKVFKPTKRGKMYKRAISSAIGLKYNNETGKDEMVYSYHIVLPTIGFYKEEPLFKEIIKSIKTDLNGIDVSLYSKNHALRSLNQAKGAETGDKRRVLKIHLKSSTQKWSDHLVQEEFENDAGSEEFKNIYEGLKKENVVRINKIKKEKGCYKVNSARFDYLKQLKDKNGDFVECPLFDLRRDNPNYWLMELPNLSADGYRYNKAHFKMLMKTYKMWGGKKEFYPPASYDGWKKFEEKYDGNEKSYFSETDWNNCDKEDKNYKWGITGLRELIEQFYGKINDPIEKMIKQTIWNDDGDLIIKPKYKINPLNGEEEMVKLSDKFLAKHIKDFERKGYEKWAMNVVLNLGAGKTYAVLDWLGDKIKENPDITVCWLIHRRSMADNLYMRNDIMPVDEFESRCLKLGFKNYKNIKNKADGNEYGSKPAEIQNLKASPRMIMSVFSLKCVGDLIKYDYVIADEIESIYGAFKNERPCHGQNGEFFDNNYRTFERLITEAKGVMLMDAFMNKRTPKYLKILNADRKQLLITRTKEADDIKKKVYTCASFMTWFEKIVEVLKEGKKAYVFFPFKTDKNVWEMSMEDLVNRLCACSNLDPKINARYYHADVNQKEKKTDLENTTKVWGSPEVRLVMTNSCITVGVNCDEAYDVCFASWAIFLDPRDMAQSLMRVREWNTNLIYYLKFDSVPERIARDAKQDYYLPAFVRPKLEGEPTKGWMFLRDTIENEHYSFSSAMVRHYFKKCGYELVGEWLELEDSAKALWTDASGNDLTNSYAYTSIEDIDKEMYREINGRCEKEEATAKEKLQMKKYFLNKKVRNVPNDNQLKLVKCKIDNWENDTVANQLTRIMDRGDTGHYHPVIEREHKSLRFVFTLDNWETYYKVKIGKKVIITNAHRWVEDGNLVKLVKDTTGKSQKEIVVEDFHKKPRWKFNKNKISKVDRRDIVMKDVSLELPYRRSAEVYKMSDNIMKKQIAEAYLKTTVFDMGGKSPKFRDKFLDLLLLNQRYNINFNGIGEILGYEPYVQKILEQLIMKLWENQEDNNTKELVSYQDYIEGVGNPNLRLERKGCFIAKPNAINNLTPKYYQIKLCGKCYIKDGKTFEFLTRTGRGWNDEEWLPKYERVEVEELKDN